MPIITTTGQPTQSIPKQNATTTLPPRLQSAFTPTHVQPVTPPQQTVQPVVDDDISDDFDLSDNSNDDDDVFGSAPVSTGKPGNSLSRMSEEERRKIISTTFMLILGRNPSDRDFSYYRFSTLTEESLIKSLLGLPEHKKLVEKAREHTSLKQSVSELDLQVKQLSASMQSMKQELGTMQDLLIEKNKYIQQMRGVTPESELVINNRQPSVPVATGAELTHDVSQVQAKPTPKQEMPMVEMRKLPGPMDEIKNIFKGIFSGKS
ncbi:hypothetical protein IT418_01270 [bacterium]|nr:hypothetical protein [bacterium]